MKRRLSALLGTLILAAACGSDEQGPEESLRRDLSGLESVFNRGETDSIYDECMATHCRERLSLQADEDASPYKPATPN